jgi:hypothetical protein
MRDATLLTPRTGIALALTLALVGCGKMKQSDPHDSVKADARTKRQRAACGSSVAYDRLKGLMFDEAIGRHNGDRANLDTLADYSFARMKEPIVEGWDQALDITRCKGRIILDLPPGTERAFAGERHLQADVHYTAQAAADGSGFVYQLKGAEPIVVKLAAFNLTSVAFRPPPAIDQGQREPAASESTLTSIGRAAVPAPLPSVAGTPSPPESGERFAPARQQTTRLRRALDQADLEHREPMADGSAGGTAVATIRAFYTALGAGNGVTASAQIIPEKRSSRAFSPEAISRFYGRLPEPIRLTGVVPLARDAYRVSYRYSAGRSRCHGSAVVSLTQRNGRDLIRSIRALSGC